MSRVRMRSAILAVASTVTPHLAHAQTVGGEIVGLESQKPVHGANVALVDDSANIVSSTAADTANGMFYVDAPHAGHYRVVIFSPSGSFVSPAMQLDSAQTVERRFSVPEIPGKLLGAYFAQDVTTPAQRLRPDDAPRYPSEESGTGATGLVVFMFVVDEHGHVDRKTVQVINDADYLFAKAAREWLVNVHYVPAIKDGTAVRQVAQFSIGFGTPGKTPTADLMVTALGVSRPRVRVETKITSEELPPRGGVDLDVPPIHP